MGGRQGGHDRPTPVVPFRIRVGITGHRAFSPEDAAAVAVAMDEVLAAIRDLVPGSPRTPTLLSMISPLAEGADRIAAHAALRVPGTRLEAPIPFPADDYETDFVADKSDSAATQSRQEFRTLLETATTSHVLGTRADGYRPVGWYVVDRADVLVAVWDGEGSRGLGGTAEIVRRAVENNVPVVWIPTGAPEQWGDYVPPATDAAAEPSGTRLGSQSASEVGAGLRREYERIDHYNATALELRSRQAQASQAHPDPSDPDGWVDGWVADAIQAADTLAEFYRRRYRRLMRLTFILAVIAATAITAQTAFAGESVIDPFHWRPGSSFEMDFPWLGFLEVLSLAALVVVVTLSHRGDTHRCYLEYRFFTERLRAAPYLAIVGSSARDVRPSILNADFIVYRSEGWPWRAFDEIWNRREHRTLDPTDVPELRDLIAERWIRDERAESPRRTVGRQGETEYCRAVQALASRSGPPDRSQFGYHQRTYCRERRVQRQLGVWVSGLFIVTGASAIAHMVLEMMQEAEDVGFTWPHAAVFLSISVAAAGAALSGYLAQRGHRQQATRSLRMLTYLAIDNERVRTAESADALRQLVEDTHHHMLAENRLWFEGLSYEEVELHT